MIRITLIAIFLVLFFLLSLPLCLLEWILEKLDFMNVRNKISKAVVGWGFRVCLFISGVKIEASGTENIPKDTPILIVGNHNSMFDILVSYTVIPNIFGFVAKKESKKVPFLNMWMHFINCLWIDRDNMKESLKTILKGIEQLKSGISVCIFPEGTRSKDGKMLPFKEGSLKMAEKAKCPVLPIAMKGTAEIFERQFPKIRKGTVKIQIGKPFLAADLEPEQRKFLGAYTQEIIQNMLDKM